MRYRSSLRRLLQNHCPERAAEVVRAAYYLGRHVAGRFSVEPEIAFLRSLVRPNDCVVDVGANVGAYTVPLARLVRPKGLVFAFEPIPATCRTLKVCVFALGLSRQVRLFQVAVSDAVGEVMMAVPSFDDGGLNFYQAAIVGGATNGPHLRVPAVRLDDIDELRKVPLAFLKVDAEGHDSRVLGGAMELIARARPVIFVESPPGSESDSSTAVGVGGRLRRLGYEPFVLDGGRLRRVEQVKGLLNVFYVPSSNRVSGLTL